MLEIIKEKTGLAGDDPGRYSPLSLAFIGDSIYGATVKTIVVLEGNCPANRLDAKAVRYVRATAQAAAADYLLENGIFTEEETAVYRRGRNAKSPTTAKNASVSEYRRATGLEAVVGYVYLKGDIERVTEIIRIAMQAVR